MSAVEYWRIFLLVVCSLSFLILLNRFRLNRSRWNTKTRDYWYALTMWSFAGVFGNTESVIRGTPFKYSIVFTTAASLATFFGVLRPGTWGDHKEDSK